MNLKFMRGITTGAVIGVAAGMLMAPQMSRGTRRRLKRNGRVMMNTAEGIYDTVMNLSR